MQFDFTILKRYFWVVHLLLMTLIVVLGAEMIQSYRSAKRPTPFSLAPAPPRSSPDHQLVATLADYQIIVTRDFFNAAPQKPPAPQQPSPPNIPQRQAMPLQLELVGTVTSPRATSMPFLRTCARRGCRPYIKLGISCRGAAGIRPQLYRNFCREYSLSACQTGHCPNSATKGLLQNLYQLPQWSPQQPPRLSSSTLGDRNLH